MSQTISGIENLAWQALYRLGGIAALLAVFVFRRNLGAELMASKGLGVFTVPETGGWEPRRAKRPCNQPCYQPAF